MRPPVASGPAALAAAVLTAAFALLAAPAGAQDGADVDAMIEAGRLQEAAWILLEAGDTARAEAVLDRLLALLRNEPLSARPLGMDSQGVSFTWRLDHGQGVESIFKVDGSDIFCPECGAEREVAAYRLDVLLGFDLTPMTVLTRFTNRGDTLTGSTMYFVRGAESPAELGVEKPDALRAFDAIIGNSDRHADNWLMVDGRVVAIDHNRAFEHQPSTRPKTCWEQQVDSMASPGSLGPAWERYRSLPADSFRAALDGVVEPAIIEGFLAVRDRVIARVEAWAADPDADPPLVDCNLP